TIRTRRSTKLVIAIASTNDDQLGSVSAELHDIAECLENGAFCGGREMQHDFPVGCETIHDVVEGAIIEKAAFMDDEDAGAQRGDIGHVVAGQKDGGFVPLVVGPEESANGLL